MTSTQMVSCAYVGFKQTKRHFFKGQLNSEWIYEVIVCPKIPTKNYRDFCPGILLLQGYYKSESIFLQNEHRLSFGINLEVVNWCSMAYLCRKLKVLNIWHIIIGCCSSNPELIRKLRFYYSSGLTLQLVDFQF